MQLSFILIYASVFISVITADSYLHRLSEKNFTSIVEDDQYIVKVVMFYAPWCSFSKEFLPEFEELAYNLREEDDIAMALVDCVANPEIFHSQGLDGQGFPTIKAFVDGGDPITFNDERNAQNIMKFINTLIVTSYSVVRDKNDISKIGEGSSYKCLLYAEYPGVGDEERQELIVAFDYACKKQKANCAVTDFAEAKKYLGDPADKYGIVMFRDYPGEMSVLSAPNTIAKSGNSLSTWMNSKSFPIIVPIGINEQISAPMFNPSRLGYKSHIIVVSDFAKQKNGGHDLLEAMRAVATKEGIEGACVFGYLDYTNISEYGALVLNDLKLTAIDKPVVISVSTKVTSVIFTKVDLPSSIPEAEELIEEFTRKTVVNGESDLRFTVYHSFVEEYTPSEEL